MNDPLIGKLIYDYRIEELIGEGAMGIVYKGTHIQLLWPAAIKMLRPELAHDPQLRERFRQEAKIQMSLTHENIAQVRGFTQDDDGNLFIIMEFVPGQSLEDWIKDRVKNYSVSAQSYKQALKLFKQILAGMKYAHNRQPPIVHRDLKPSNIMGTDTDQVKITDFGIAQIVGKKRLTDMGIVVGTLPYMSPEQVYGVEELDECSDVYTLGVILYEMLTGQLPFDSESNSEIRKAILKRAPRPPRKLDKTIPGWIDEAIMQALEKQRHKRFQNAGKFLDFLEETHDGGSWWDKIVRIVRKVIRPAVLLPLVALILTVAGWFVGKSSNPPPPPPVDKQFPENRYRADMLLVQKWGPIFGSVVKHDGNVLEFTAPGSISVLKDSTSASLSFDNFIWHIGVKFLAGAKPAEDFIGLAFRAQDPSNAYEFGIFGDGHYTLRKKHGGQIISIIPRTASSVINSGAGARNTLEVVCHGPTIELYANGKRLQEPVPDSDFTAGMIGLLVDTPDKHQGIHVLFDEILVYSIKIDSGKD